MTTATDPQTAWVTAPRDAERDRWHAMYDALHPRPRVTDCSHLHSAFGPGCPHCWTPTSRAAARTPIAAGRRATTTNGATS